MTIAIEQLKRDVRKHYEAVTDIADTYTCGLSLAMHINPVIAKHAAEFNRIMDELAKVDPNTPAFRYEVKP